MSEEKKDAPPSKFKMTNQRLDRQLDQTHKDLIATQKKADGLVELLNYLLMLKEKYEFPDEPKPEAPKVTPLEVK